MGLKSLYIFFLLSVFTTSHAQFEGVEIAVSKNLRLFVPGQGFAAGGNGACFRVNGNFLLNNNFFASGGGELGANGIGNYLSSSLGIHHLFDLPGDKFILTVGLATQHGIGLFYPSGLYIFGLAEVNTISYQLQNGNRLGLLVEFRYYSSPGYASISEVNSFVDLLIGMNLSFR